MNSTPRLPFRTLILRHFNHRALWIAFILISLIIGTDHTFKAESAQHYVHPDGLCAGLTPCHRTLRDALIAVKTRETITIQATLTETITYADSPLPTGVTLRGDSAQVVLFGKLTLRALRGWTIRDLAVTEGIQVDDPLESLTIERTVTASIYVIGTRDLDADLTIRANTLPDIFEFPKITSEISILGGDGYKLGGNYRIEDNRGVGAVNIFTYVGAGGCAELNATITISDNDIKNSANLGITYRGQNSGVGAINGAIIFTRNRVTTADKGLNVTVDGPGTRGDINGSMTFSGNTADKLAVITIDSLGGDMRGDFVAVGNRGERIEFGIKGSCTSRLIQIERNLLSYNGSPENSVITVRANAFSDQSMIQIRDNFERFLSRFGIVVQTYTGSNAAFTRIQNNHTFFIVYQTATASSGQLEIIGNQVLCCDPRNSSYNGGLHLLIGAGDFFGGVVRDNTVDNLNVRIATRLVKILTITGNTVQYATTIKTDGVTGTGFVTMSANVLNSVTVDQTIVAAHFNVLLGTTTARNDAQLDAANNWWGCSAPVSNPCRQPIITESGATVISEPYLVFKAALACTGSARKIVVTANFLTNSLGQQPAENVLNAYALYHNPEAEGTISILRGWGTVLFTTEQDSFSASVQAGSDAPIQLTGTCPTRRETVGLYRPAEGVFYLKDENASPGATLAIPFGVPNLIPLAGDWDGDGVDTIGVYDPATGVFQLRDTNSAGNADYTFTFGRPSGRPKAGRWDAGMTGDGVGVFDAASGMIYLRRALSGGTSDFAIILGAPGDLPIAGDWDGDAFDGIGLYRPKEARFYLLDRADQTGDVLVTQAFTFGEASDLPLAGDWTGRGMDGIGLYRVTGQAGFMILKDAPNSGEPDRVFGFGVAGDLPISGHWR